LPDIDTTNKAAETSDSSFFPIGFNTALGTYRSTNGLEALIFLISNLMVGSLGIWLPILNAVMTGQPIDIELARNLDGGQFYIYAITLTAANGGVAFVSLLRNRIEQAIKTRVVLIGLTVLLLFISGLLLQAELMRGMNVANSPLWAPWFNWAVQLVWSFETILLSIFVYSFIATEEDGNPKVDVDSGADKLASRVRNQDLGDKGPNDWTTS
jgi:hypothetical protein